MSQATTAALETAAAPASDAEAILAAGVAVSDIRYVGARPIAIVPKGYSAHDLEHMLPEPTRPRGHITVLDASSFERVVNANKTSRTMLLYAVLADNAGATFSANFAIGSRDAGYGWADHTCEYSCPFSPDWQAWAATSGKAKPQADYARFMEDHAAACITPGAAAMIEISRTLEAKRKVDFASSVRLDNGQTQLLYEEQLHGTAAKGQIQIPETFEIGVPVFLGEAAYRVTCRLRYRIDGARLFMWHEIVRPDIIIEDAIGIMRQRIEANTGLPAVRGAVHSNGYGAAGAR